MERFAMQLNDPGKDKEVLAKCFGDWFPPNPGMPFLLEPNNNTKVSDSAADSKLGLPALDLTQQENCLVSKENGSTSVKSPLGDADVKWENNGGKGNVDVKSPLGTSNTKWDRAQGTGSVDVKSPMGDVDVNWNNNGRGGEVKVGPIHIQW